jgi:hypothetical protein
VTLSVIRGTSWPEDVDNKLRESNIVTLGNGQQPKSIPDRLKSIRYRASRRINGHIDRKLRLNTHKSACWRAT